MRTVILIALMALAATPTNAETCQTRPKPGTTYVKNTSANAHARPQQHRLGHLVPATRWSPSIWVGTDWQDGPCPRD